MSFSVVHAPLHGNSATIDDLQHALSLGAIAVGFSEMGAPGKRELAEWAHKRPSWRATGSLSTARDARNRFMKRDSQLLVRKRGNRSFERGVLFGCAASTPLKIAPERQICYDVFQQGGPLAVITLHPHAAVRSAWKSDRAEKYRREMERLVALIHRLQRKYGKDLAIIVMGDLNYPDVSEPSRHLAPHQLLSDLGLNFLSHGIDYVAWSQNLRSTGHTIITNNGQDHPWIRAAFRRK